MINLNSINISATYGNDINININKYSDEINLNASRSNGARSESLNVSYDKINGRNQEIHDTSVPFTAEFLSEVDVLVEKIFSLDTVE